MIGRLYLSAGNGLSIRNSSSTEHFSVEAKNQSGERETVTRPSIGRCPLIGSFLRRLALGAVALAALLGGGINAFAQAYNFSAATNVGASQSQLVTVNIATSGTPSAIKVLTAGIAGLDYASTSGGSCSTGTAYTAGGTCTVMTQFTPAYPGLRSGAVVLLDASGTVLGTTLLTGTGTGPLSVMYAGELTTVAGNTFNNGPASSGPNATFNQINAPVGVAVDGAGNFYYSDSLNNAIRKVTPSGSFTTIAGTNGISGYTGDGSPAPSAEVNTPTALLLDGAGNLYFCDSGNNVVRKIFNATGSTVGNIVTVAGMQPGTAGYSGDGGAATSAMMRNPQGLALDLSGNLLIADTDNNVIRGVLAGNGTITTIAGIQASAPGLTGDGGQASSATLDAPTGLFMAPAGNNFGVLYIADTGDNVVRKIDAATGIITTVAGNGTAHYSGDNGPATSATMNNPTSVAVDAAGNLLIADSQNQVIRKVSGVTGNIITFAGDSLFGYGGNNLDANAPGAQFTKLGQIALDGTGNIFIADEKDSVIRLISGTVGALQYPAVKATNPSKPEPQALENDGNAPLTITAITPVSNAQVDPGTTTCALNTPIAVGSDCVVGAIFDPAVAGSTPTTPVQGSINIVSNSATTPVAIDLSGDSLSIFPTAITVTANPNPGALGGTVQLVAQITDTGGTFNTTPLTGTVTFYDSFTGSSVQLGTAQTVSGNGNGKGIATYNYVGLAPVGTHPISATYSGDSGDATSNTTVNYLEQIDQPTVTSVAANPSPGTVFGNVIFTATVTATNTSATTPTGSVTFSYNGTAFPGQPVNLTSAGSGSATASFPYNLLVKGTYTITAVYSGDGSNLASSGTTPETINLATATVTLASSTGTAFVTQPITFTATVTGVSGNTPSGNVVFNDTFNGATIQIGTAAINPANGTATLANYTGLAVGPNHSVTATYQGDNTNYGASSRSNAVGETIQQVPTTAVLTPGNTTGIAGKPVNFTVTVNSSIASINLPVTGSITLTQGGAVVGTGRLTAAGTNPSTATASIPVTLGPGPYALSASYPGDTNYVASTSSGSLVVNAATTTTVLSPATQATLATQTATISATVTGTGGTPGGTVSFTDLTTGVALPPQTLNAAGAATLRISNLSVGTHTIIGTYQGDANDSASTASNAVTVTVSAATTTLSLAPSTNPTLNGQPFSLTASLVTGLGSDTPTGNITFTDSVTSDPTVTVPLRNGVATFNSSTLTDGVHTFTATYTGDANNSSASKTQSVTVLQTAQLVVTGNPTGPIAARQGVTFTATLTPLQQIPANGQITFLNNGKAIGTGTLSGDVASFTTSALPVGTNIITASFTSDGTTESVTSAAYQQVVNADGVTLTVVASSNPATFGAPLTLTATGAGTNGPLTGTVLFNDTFNGVTSTIGTPSFSSGIATTTTTSLQPGQHSVVAVYNGDANDSSATSPTPAAFIVKRQTNTVVTADSNPQVSLAPVKLTATVTNGSNTVFATGIVTFYDGTSMVGTGTLNTSGAASLTIASLPVGTHNFTAQYPGDSVDLPSTSANYAEGINLRQTATDLSTTASSLSGGQQMTLISVVQSLGGSVVPTGTVVFYTGSSVLATQPLDGNGVATVTVLLTTPTAALTAVYSGDQSYASSTSAVDNVTLSPAPNFNLLVSPSAISVVATQHTTVSLTLTSMKSFTDTLQLGCVGLPQAATCTFSQSGKTITSVMLPAGGAQTVSLTIDTGNPLQAGAQANLRRAARPGPSDRSTASLVLACVLPGCFLLGLFGLRTRRLRSFGGLLMLLCLAGASAALSGCASLNINGTPLGSYTFRVTAVGQTGVTQATSVTLTVTQ